MKMSGGFLVASLGVFLVYTGSKITTAFLCGDCILFLFDYLDVWGLNVWYLNQDNVAGFARFNIAI